MAEGRPRAVPGILAGFGPDRCPVPQDDGPALGPGLCRPLVLGDRERADQQFFRGERPLVRRIGFVPVCRIYVGSADCVDRPVRAADREWSEPRGCLLLRHGDCGDHQPRGVPVRKRHRSRRGFLQFSSARPDERLLFFTGRPDAGQDPVG